MNTALEYLLYELPSFKYRRILAHCHVRAGKYQSRKVIFYVIKYSILSFSWYSIVARSVTIVIYCIAIWVICAECLDHSRDGVKWRLKTVLFEKLDLAHLNQAPPFFKIIKQIIVCVRIHSQCLYLTGKHGHIRHNIKVK